MSSSSLRPKEGRRTHLVSANMKFAHSKNAPIAKQPSELMAHLHTRLESDAQLIDPFFLEVVVDVGLLLVLVAEFLPVPVVEAEVDVDVDVFVGKPDTLISFQLEPVLGWD